MDNTRDYEGLLLAGNKAQLEKLEENKHKSGFDKIEIEEAVGRVEEEAEELRGSVFRKEVHYYDGKHIVLHYKKKDKDYAEIRREAADVANFAHMIILACDKELEIGGIKDDQ